MLSNLVRGLNRRDRQIEQQGIKALTAALTTVQLSVKAEQALHAGTIYKELQSLLLINGKPLDE